MPHQETLTKYIIASFHGTTLEGDVIYIIRAGLGNPVALLKAVPAETVLDFMVGRA